MSLAEGELTHALDEIVSVLGGRERIINDRLAEMTKHFGLEERVLIEKKNFGKELEDAPPLDHTLDLRFVAEDILSVNEQIYNVQ